MKNFVCFSVILVFFLFSCTSADNILQANSILLNNNSDGGPSKPAGWWNANWNYRRQLTFNNSAQSENLQNFPVLVELNSSRINYNSVQDNGEDIRFVDSDGTLLSHEIETWDESGNSYVWVNVPQIDGSSSIDYIWMYYGNNGAGDGQDAVNVWNANYLSVWHLDEAASGTGTSDLYTDSTGNNHGNDGVSAAGKDGQIGYGQEFNGAGDHIESTTYTYVLTSSITMEGWFRFTGSGNGSPRILEISALGDANSQCLAVDSNASLRAWLQDGSGRQADVDDSTTYASGWHYMVYTFNGSAGLLYVDGNQTASVSDSVSNIEGGAYLILGAISEGSGAYNYSQHCYEGFIDEIRVSDTNRSEDWVDAQYASMTDNFVIYGAEEE